MALYYQANTQELIEKTAVELKNSGRIRPPEWASYVKTGSDRERPPANEDWWYMRSAAVLRKVAVIGPIGVSKLRTIFGSRVNRGHKKEKHRRTGGNILRKILQQLEAAQYVKMQKKGVHKGRILAPAGQQLLDKTALTIQKNKPAPKVEVKPVVKEPEAPKQEVKKAPVKETKETTSEPKNE
jgi:small subunit ribosomal protein S19e